MGNMNYDVMVIPGLPVTRSEGQVRLWPEATSHISIGQTAPYRSERLEELGVLLNGDQYQPLHWQLGRDGDT